MGGDLVAEGGRAKERMQGKRPFRRSDAPRPFRRL